MTPLCLKKSELLEAYEEAVAAHSAAMTDLRHKMGVLTQREYDHAYASAEALRMEARMAQEKLNRHVTQHGC